MSPTVDSIVTLDPNLPGSTRLAAWRDMMSLSGEVEVDDAEALVGEFHSRSLIDLLTMRIRASTFRLIRSPAFAASAPRDHVLINLIETGHMRGRLAGRRFSAGPGALIISRLTNPLDIVIEHADWLALILPLSTVARHLTWKGRFDGMTFAAGSIQATTIGGLIRSLFTLSGDLTTLDTTYAARTTALMLASCLDDPATKHRLQLDDQDALLRSIRRFVVERLADPALDPETICRSFSLSRSGLYRILGDQGDVAGVIRRLRLRRALTDVVSTAPWRESISTIAAKWGFASERSFRRSFSREFGVSPSQVRQRKTKIPIPSPELERWFLGI